MSPNFHGFPRRPQQVGAYWLRTKKGPAAVVWKNGYADRAEEGYKPYSV
jgi:hypothetical protein